MNCHDELHSGDNTAAFGNNYIVIFEDNPLAVPVSKIEFVVGCIKKTFKDPKFPLYVNFNSKETAKLNYINTAHLIAYDDKGRREVCDGTLTFYVINGVIRQDGKC